MVVGWVAGRASFVSSFGWSVVFFVLFSSSISFVVFGGSGGPLVLVSFFLAPFVGGTSEIFNKVLSVRCMYSCVYRFGTGGQWRTFHALANEDYE